MTRRIRDTSKPARRAPLAVDEIIAGVTREWPEPVSAYDIVDILAKRNERVAPQQVYRSFERLRSQGAVVRIESLNAYCAGSDVDHAVLYCESCGSHLLLPVPSLFAQLSALAQKAEYHPSRTIIEVAGRCAACGPPQPGEAS